MYESPRRRETLSIVTAGISLACHLAALWIYTILHDVGPSFSATDAQVVVLGSLLGAGVIGSYFVEPRWLSRLVFLVRLLVYFALFTPYPVWFDMRLLLLTAIVFEIGVYEPYPINLVVAGAAIGTSFVTMELVQMISFDASPTIIPRVLLFTLLPTIVGVTAGFLTRYRERLIEATEVNDRLDIAVSQLSRSNVMLQDAAFHAAEKSRNSERHRIAREIHDTIGYTLTNLIMMMEAATDLVFDYPERVQTMMQAARAQAKSGLDETRRSLRELREQEDSPIRGLAAIKQLVSTYDTVGAVEVEVEYGNVPASFGEEVDSMLFHFVQEGLTNALRHGRATRIWVRFWMSDEGLKVVIRDNGRGSVVVTEGIGLSGMRERAARFRGAIAAENVADGFQTSLILPMIAERSE